MYRQLLRKTSAIAISLSLVLPVSGYAGGHGEPQPPNVLLVVADDLGFSDLGFVGSEIRTPTIDGLAKEGAFLSQFYTAPTCSPTRAMLLSGVDHHRAGLGSMHESMGEELRAKPGYEGYLNDSVMHLPAILKANGYHTFMAGKWHLGLTKEQSAHARGFEQSFTLLNGGASHFADRAGLFEVAPVAAYRENGELVDELPKDFFSSTFYAQKTIEYIDEAVNRGRPFFGYLAFTAPHWPLQAPDDYIGRYRGQYDSGWEALRQRRFANLKARGLVPEEVGLSPGLASVPDWAALSKSEQVIQAREMEVYAAMVEHMDEQLGRVMSHLSERKLLDNTLVIFMSDNGPEGIDGAEILGNDSWVPRRFNNTLENMGRVDSYLALGAGWAQASAAPSRLFKSFTTEGGIRAPAIIRFSGLTSKDTIVDAAISVADIFPTILELANIEVSADYSAQTMSGKSFARGLVNGQWDESRTMAWELFGRSAVRQGAFKAIKMHPPVGTGEWELYDLNKDPSESQNLAKTKPERLAELLDLWQDYVEDNGVVELDSDAGYGDITRASHLR